MNRKECLAKIQEELENNPLVIVSSLLDELPYSDDFIRNGIHELSKNGNESAQIWVETSRMRSRKTFIFVLQLFAHALEHKLTPEEISEMDLLPSADSYSENGNILSILKIKPHRQGRYKTLLHTRKHTLEFMGKCTDYDPTNVRIEYKLNSEQINRALMDYGILEDSSSSQDKSRPASTTQLYPFQQNHFSTKVLKDLRSSS